MKRHWPVGAEVSEAAFEGGRMLYDTQRTSNFSPEFFEPEYWRQHEAIEAPPAAAAPPGHPQRRQQLRAASLPARRADGKNFHGQILVAGRE
jgi:hypothetical protein